jgi:hypothetical protein
MLFGLGAGETMTAAKPPYSSGLGLTKAHTLFNNIIAVLLVNGSSTTRIFRYADLPFAPK